MWSRWIGSLSKWKNDHKFLNKNTKIINFIFYWWKQSKFPKTISYPPNLIIYFVSGYLIYQYNQEETIRKHWLNMFFVCIESSEEEIKENFFYIFVFDEIYRIEYLHWTNTIILARIIPHWFFFVGRRKIMLPIASFLSLLTIVWNRSTRKFQ